MRSITMAVLALGLAAAAAGAQEPAQRRGPPPDHWMTMDSLAAAVSLSDAQRPEFVAHYDALNAVMKQAADERRKMMEQAGDARPTRDQMQAMRTKLQGLQTEVDAHYQELRKLLSAEQQASFDSLPKPRVIMQARQPSGG